MTGQQFFLGIDGGGTQCRARIVDAEGKILGEGQAGPANTRLGIARVFGEVRKAAAAALDAAGRDESGLADLHAGMGLAGLSLQSDLEKVVAEPHPFASLVVDTDAFVACLGAHQGEDGGIMVLGTGSCGCGVLDGETFTVGGWGFLLADHGAGAWVGREALKAGLLAHDGVIPGSGLSEHLLARFEGAPEKAVIWATAAEPADYGEIARQVVDFAARSDPLACQLMQEAGADASKLIRTLAAHGLSRIALTGGFSAPLRPWFDADVEPLLVNPRGDALDGAIILARRALEKRGAAE